MFWCCCEPTIGCPTAYYDGFSTFSPVDINDVPIPRDDHWQDYSWITRNVSEPFYWARAESGQLAVGLQPIGSTSYVYAFRCFNGAPISTYSAGRLGEWYELETKVTEFTPGFLPVAGDVVAIDLLGSWNYTNAVAGFRAFPIGATFYWYLVDPGGGSTATGIQPAVDQVLRQRLEVVEPDPGDDNFWQFSGWINGVLVGQVKASWALLQTHQLASFTVAARWGLEAKIDYWNHTSSFM